MRVRATKRTLGAREFFAAKDIIGTFVASLFILNDKPFDVGIDYAANIDRARTIILEEGADITGVLADPAPSAPVTGLGDSAVVFNGWLWVNPQETGAGGVRAEFVERVKGRFDTEGIAMPYPHRQIVGSLDINSTHPMTAPSDDRTVSSWGSSVSWWWIFSTVPRPNRF